MPNNEPSLKLRTARSIKWNTIDRVSSQVLYAVTGVVLANLLSQEDFGLVGALLVFQAFGILFVDSGFGAALLRKKEATQRDWSTVFWFNLMVSLVVYSILYFCAPLISDIFQHDRRLIPLSRVMFLSFILNGLGLVQTVKLTKAMDVRRVAAANVLGLIVSGAAGIILAVKGFGAWALVWQTVILALVKTGWLWIRSGWLPSLVFTKDSMSQIWRVGLSVFSTSSLNTFFLYIYSFVIGAFYNLAALGVYTQADKWSKMGSASISQVMTSSFVPLLAKFQDDAQNFHRYVSRINRFTAFAVFPIMCGIACVGTPLFHTLFGDKWDAAIPLFQILSIRGIFVVLISLCTNYLLALGYGRKLVEVEIVKDCLVFIAILCTIWFDSVELLVWGQFAASLLTWIAALIILHKAANFNIARILKENLPYAGAALLMSAICVATTWIPMTAILQLLVTITAGILSYVIISKLCGFKELGESSEYIFGRFRK